MKIKKQIPVYMILDIVNELPGIAQASQHKKVKKFI